KSKAKGIVIQNVGYGSISIPSCGKEGSGRGDAITSAEALLAASCSSPVNSAWIAYAPMCLSLIFRCATPSAPVGLTPSFRLPKDVLAEKVTGLKPKAAPSASCSLAETITAGTGGTAA